MKTSNDSATLWGAVKNSKYWIIFNLLGLLGYILICFLGRPEMTPIGYYLGNKFESFMIFLIIATFFANIGWLLWSLMRAKWASLFVSIFVLFGWIYEALFMENIIRFCLKYIFGYF